MPRSPGRTRLPFAAILAARFRPPRINRKQTHAGKPRVDRGRYPATVSSPFTNQKLSRRALHKRAPVCPGDRSAGRRQPVWSAESFGPVQYRAERGWTHEDWPPWPLALTTSYAETPVHQALLLRPAIGKKELSIPCHGRGRHVREGNWCRAGQLGKGVTYGAAMDSAGDLFIVGGTVPSLFVVAPCFWKNGTYTPLPMGSANTWAVACQIAVVGP